MRINKWLCLMMAICLLTISLVAAVAEEVQDISSNDMAEADVFEVNTLEADDAEPEEALVPNASGIALTEANFPDASFRSYLQTKCDEDGDGFLSEEEIEWHVGDLYLEDEMIASLKGIELFPDLRGLDCSGNLLTSLDLSGNPNLESLYCSGNMLTSLNLSKNTKLTHLYCDTNQLTVLDISKNTQLESFYCGWNRLKELNVAGSKQLKRLNCYGNQLKNLKINQCPHLTELNCSNNQLSQLDISGNSMLHALECYGNQINTLDLSAFNSTIQSLFAKTDIYEDDDTLQIGNDTYYVYCDDYVELILNGKILHPLNPRISFDADEVKLTVGNTYQIKPVFVPAGAKPALTYHTDDNCVTVSKKGLVTAVDEGYAKVTVTTEGGREESIWFEVNEPIVPPTKIKIYPTKATLGVKEKIELWYDLTPSDASAEVTWKSSKPAVATVSKSGKVTAKKVGTTKITVTTDNGKKSTATITVMTFNGKKASVKITVK